NPQLGQVTLQEQGRLDRGFEGRLDVYLDGAIDLDVGPGQIFLGFVQIVLIPREVVRIAPERSWDGDGIAHDASLHQILDEALIVEGMAQRLAYVQVSERRALIVHADDKEAH